LLAGMHVVERGISGDLRFGGPGFSDAELQVGRQMERLAQDWGLRPHQVALAWLLSRPGVASVIVGAETVEELIANASAVEIVLSQAQLDELTRLGDATTT
jgi:1-deoxyxylulose-5-phosphate synthase